MKSKTLKPPLIHTGSMADIAFLLLIFFLVATTTEQEKGLMQQLPPKSEDPKAAKIPDRNLFRVLINSNNQYLVQGEMRNDLLGLREEIKTFVMNHGRNPYLSDAPEKAIVSIKAHRGTEYHCFISVLDEIKEAYYELYGTRVGLSAADYRHLDHRDPRQYRVYLEGKAGIPMNISIADPEP